MAKLIIPTPLRKYAADSAHFETDSMTVEQALEELTDKFPDLKNHLLDGNDQVRSYIKVFVGEDDIKALDGLETELAEDDIVSIVPAIAGGAL
ncbi:MAG: MoaD/ThiS family protein [Bacteroidetes bacterium]|nr:MoaD/ThiS family protein [Bacteroidota bacterium]